MKKHMLILVSVLTALLFFSQSCTKKSPSEPVQNTTVATRTPTINLSATVTGTCTEMSTLTSTVTITVTATITITPLPTANIIPSDICKVFGNNYFTDSGLQTMGRTTLGKYVLTAQATVTHIYFYAGNDGVEHIYKVGIYSDNGNFPGALLTTGTSTCFIGNKGWYSVDIDDITLSAGTYWLALASPDVSSSPAFGFVNDNTGSGGLYQIHNVVLPDNFSAYSSFNESYPTWSVTIFASCD